MEPGVDINSNFVDRVQLCLRSGATPRLVGQFRSEMAKPDRGFSENEPPRRRGTSFLHYLTCFSKKFGMWKSRTEDGERRYVWAKNSVGDKYGIFCRVLPGFEACF